MDRVRRALLPLPEVPIAVGFSGGIDSAVLLHALASSASATAQGLRAIHVHHGLQPNADAWATHCELICAELDVPLQIMCVRVEHSAGRGPEGAARAARLDAFRLTLRDGALLALAHHRDDQAETILLRLMRGAGGDGLAAMRRRSRLGSLHLWRPLLGLPRSDLHDYAATHALRWIEDPSNDDTRYDRNFLRNRVVPLLAERWPQASRNLARSAALLADQAGLLATATDVKLDTLLDANHAICVHTLLAQSRAQRAQLVRAWLRRLHYPSATASILASIESDLLPARTDGDGCVAWADVALYRWRDQLHALRHTLPLRNDWSVIWDGREPLVLPDSASLALHGADAFEMPLTVRARRGGERIRLPHRGHTHALKNVLQDRDVPPWLRKRMPLLFAADGELLAAGDGIISATLGVWLQRHNAHLVWSTSN